MRATAVSLLVLAVSTAACSKGSGGKTGAPGAPGLPGNWAVTPRITSVDPGVVSWDSVVVVSGADFSPNAADNEVWVGSEAAEVVSATTTALTVTHLGAPGLTSDRLDDLVVVSNDLVSNPLSVHLYPKGSAVSIPLHVPASIGAMVPRGDGSLALFRPAESEILNVTPDGDITLYAAGLSAGAFAPVDRPDGIYYLTSSGVRRWFDGNDYQILPVTGAVAMAFDATGNLYLAIPSGANTTITKREYATGAVTASFATLTNFIGASMISQGADLYVWGADLIAAATPILQIPLATPATRNVLAANVDGHSMAGDGTLLYFTGGGLVKTVDAAGTIATWSAKKLTTGVVTEIARNGSGEIFYRVGDRIWRMSDATSFTSYVAPLSATRSIGLLGSLFAGSADTCGTGDSKGGVFYEVRPDGTLRRVVTDFCGHGGTGSFAGLFYSAHLSNGSIEQVSPAGYQLVIIPASSLAQPLFVVADGQGSLYIPNSVGGTGWRVSKYDADGGILAPDFVPSFSEMPVAGAMLGTQLALGFAGSRTIAVAPAAGGALVTLPTNGFRPVPGGMTSVAGGVLVGDTQDGSLWTVLASGTASRIGPDSGDGTWFVGGDGSYMSVGTNSIDLVLP